MPIIKRFIKSNFTIIPNSLLQREDISYDARGLLVELLSRPENWKVMKAQLIREHCKQARLSRIIKELKTFGYIIITQDFDTKRQFSTKTWNISPFPMIQDKSGEISLNNAFITGEQAEMYSIKAKTIDSPSHGKPETRETSSYKERDIQIKEKTKNTKPDCDKGSPAYLLADYLYTCISNNDPKFKKPKARCLQGWSKDIEKLIRIDKAEPDDIKKVIKWVSEDDFWFSNILSGNKLRKQFTQLRMKAFGSVRKKISKAKKGGDGLTAKERVKRQQRKVS